jgi:hypothetical protein
MMKRIRDSKILAWLLAAMFILPYLLQSQPGLHNHNVINADGSHCDDDSANCPVCQFAYSPSVEAEQTEFITAPEQTVSKIVIYRENIYETIFASLYPRGPPTA